VSSDQEQRWASRRVTQALPRDLSECFRSVNTAVSVLRVCRYIPEQGQSRYARVVCYVLELGTYIPDLTALHPKGREVRVVNLLLFTKLASSNTVVQSV
jgi:hypothetical protein